jgi:hypothetical protein
MFANVHPFTKRIALAVCILAITCLPEVKVRAQHFINNESHATDEHAEREYDKKIISGMPKRKSRIYRVVAKLLGKAKGEALAMTRSECGPYPPNTPKRSPRS